MSKIAVPKGYDPTAFERPSVTVDAILLAVVDGRLKTLLVRRQEEPFAGSWALPGTFVGIDEDLESAAQRVLAQKAGVAGVAIEQLYTFGAVDRDPRMRIISVGYLAMTTAAGFANIALSEAVTSATLKAGDDGAVSALDRTEASLPLAFDHGEILRATIERLRGKIDYSPAAFAFLPDRFTLRELQTVHEAVLGRQLNKPAFRRKILDRGWLEPTGEREEGASFRPAELFRYKGSTGER